MAQFSSLVCTSLEQLSPPEPRQTLGCCAQAGFLPRAGSLGAWPGLVSSWHSRGAHARRTSTAALWSALETLVLRHQHTCAVLLARSVLCPSGGLRVL